MSRIISIMSKTKTQYEEYGKIKNAKFDAKKQKIQNKQDVFNAKLAKKIEKAK